ncbi:MAG: RtcB family protein [Candidatus Woesearchaeota archaeon]
MELKKILDNIWEIPKTGKMKVSGRVFASESLLKAIKGDNTLNQVANVAQLPGILKHSLAMPDAHQGYGFPIGGVAAFDIDEGIISPGGVGYDINCSVRILRTDLTIDQVLPKRTQIIDSLFKNVPSGVGSDGKVKLTKDMLLEVLEKGAKWAVAQGYGKKEDYEKTEEEGCMKADYRAVSNKALERGMTQLGSLGAGNHFLEIQKVDRIFDPMVAKIFGITKNDQVCIMVHCGSRGLGHQVASDYIRLMEDKYGYANLPDRELINAPIQSELGQKYFQAMSAAANFAFANKQMITHWIRESLNRIFGEQNIEVVYDVCHNIAKIEEHLIEGEKRKVCVHRKGATRSFGPGRKEIPEIYRNIGQPVILPGSMGTASYVLLGTKTAEEISFGSTAHGAGRVMSRAEALRQYRGEQIKKEMAAEGIEVKSGSWKGIAEESKYSYKDIDEVTRVSNELGIGTLVVRVKPVGVIKG